MLISEVHLLLLLLAGRGAHNNALFITFDYQCEQLSENQYWHWSVGLKRYVLTDKGQIAIDKAVEGTRGT